MNDQTFTALEKKLSTENVKEQETSFEFNGTNHIAYVYFKNDSAGKRPGIIVVPEWWGLNQYTRERARMLASLGYIAMAVDVFGNGAIGNNPQEAMQLTKPYNNDPSLAKKVIDTAITRFKTYPQLDQSKIGLIGYCFGGSVVLNAGKLGVDVKGIVGFHPSLGGAKPIKDSVKAQFLICFGADDAFEKDHVATFRKEMDESGIHYTFKTYPDAQHGFTNPGADANGKKFGIPIGYNSSADSHSWEDMKAFFQKIFQ